MSVWVFRGAYLAGVVWILAWELVAVFNHQSKDTITENVRAILVHPFSGILWFLAAATMAWSFWHLLLFRD